MISYKMSRVGARGTEIERIMGSALWASGIRGYRKNQKGVVGTPDFCWKQQKIAVFCDSSFWHGFNWSQAKKTIKVRKRFWFKKIKDNIARDKKVNRELRKEGWLVFRFWDVKIERDALLCVKDVRNALARRKRQSLWGETKSGLEPT